MRITYKLLLILIVISTVITAPVYGGNLACTVSTSCTNGTVVFKMSGTTNAHTEIYSQSNYAQLVCCTGITGLGTACSGNYVTALKLSDVTNAHAEENTLSNYSQLVCIQAPTDGTISLAYQNNNCSGYDTTLASLSGTTNAHMGNPDAYTIKVCASATDSSQSVITFSLSDNSVGFGTLSASDIRYANGDNTGSNTELVAHTITASTNAYYGYSILVQGPTLTNSLNINNTISSLGDPGNDPQSGIEQFGIRITASGGDGAAVFPYNQAAKYAYNATSTMSDQIAVDNNGNNVATTYSIRYVADISGMTEPGTYNTELTYIVVSNF